MKIFVTGSTGLLGHQIVEAAVKAGHEVLASYVNVPPHRGEPVRLDLCELRSIRPIITRLKPEVIIHTAAYTDVDGCEINRDKALKLNALATQQIALGAQEINAYMIYVSTDYVFDGQKGMYKEDDAPCPVNYYGYTKLEGERHVLASSGSRCVIRTSALYGWGKKNNFATWVLSKLSSGVTVKVVTDQHVSPTLNTNLAEMILEISEKNIAGILHAAGADRISRYDFAVELAKVFELNHKLIHPVSIDEMAWLAKRPRDSSLDISKCSSLLKSKALGVREALKAMKAQLQQAGKGIFPYVGSGQF
ncbi:MAG: dTDP-4-dehydrorhamnose reductase [Candidatus Hadarchaeum sp.]